MSKLEKILEKALYGKNKVHRASVNFKNNKAVFKTACGIKDPKFSALCNDKTTCKKCKAKIKQLKFRPEDLSGR